MRASDGTGQRGHTSPQHVWVNVDDVALPGVLIDWQQTSDGGWEALVTWATGGGAERPHARTEWVPQDRVRPLS